MEIRVRSRKFLDLSTYPFGTPPRGECLVYVFYLRDVKPQRPSKDPVADWKMLAKYSKVDSYLPQLSTKVCICADCFHRDVGSSAHACMQTMKGSHWPHMEFPQVFNAIVEEWLAGAILKDEVGGGEDVPQPEGDKGEHSVIDEL